MAELNELGTLLGLMQQGFTPDQARQQLDEARAMQMAKLTGREMTRMGLIQGAQDLRRGLMSALGQESQDPTLQMASRIRQLGSQFDLTTSDGMMQYARALQQVNPQMSQQVAMQAQKMAVQEATLGKTKAQEQQVLAQAAEAERKTAKENRLEQELSALPATATDADVEAVVRKYGKPDQIFSTIERKQRAEADRIAKAELQAEKLKAEAEQKERDRSLKETLATLMASQKSALTGLQQQMLQTKIDELKTKIQERAEKKEAGKEAAIAHAGKVLTDVQEANQLVGGMTTGLAGKASSLIPGTDAYNLNQRLLTVKANLGFDRLQQMRDASPTGGALGQVAVQELNALQSTVGSMELGQSKEELKKNLDKITFHYTNWLKAVRGEPLEIPKPMTTAPSAGGGGWSIRPKQ